jgi:hypothetical protein
VGVYGGAIPAPSKHPDDGEVSKGWRGAAAEKTRRSTLLSPPAPAVAGMIVTDAAPSCTCARATEQVPIGGPPLDPHLGPLHMEEYQVAVSAEMPVRVQCLRLDRRRHRVGYTLD